MDLEREILPLGPWLFQSGLRFAIVVVALAVLFFLLGLLIATVRNGPAAGFWITWGVIRDAFFDIVRISPRRVGALSLLAIKESIGRRVFVVLAIFLLLLMFAAWMLDPSSADPAELNIRFLLNWTTYLVVILALLLSAFSLPSEIKSRTIYTVVTKPVRPSEVVLGRIVGFTAIGTAILVVMGMASYLFVVRMINHQHTIAASALRQIKNDDGDVVALEGTTSVEEGHSHDALVDAEGSGRTTTAAGHWHEVLPEGSGGYEIGPPLGALNAREPIYGDLTFTERHGKPAPKGVNVGKEWTYRSYLEGGSLSSGIWTFKGIDEARYAGNGRRATGLPIGMTIRVFRTHKGQIDRGVLGSIVVRNPDTGQTSDIALRFQAQEFSLAEYEIPRELEDSDQAVDGKPMAVDLFDDLVTSDGRVELILKCEEGGQYFGVAKPDLFLRGNDGSFGWNFFKGYVGIWLQMTIVIALGVMFSTLVGGPIAALATAGCVLIGSYGEFVQEIALQKTREGGKVYGGGPVESLVRMVQQKNMMVPFESSNPFVGVMERLDDFMQAMMWVAFNLLPDFGSYSDINFVAKGFNIPGVLLAQHVISALAYILVVFLVGYVFLKTREVAR